MGINFTLSNALQNSTYTALLESSRAIDKTVTRLSSSFQINSAADNAAGLAVSEKMRAQISGFDRSMRNIQDGISLLQTAEYGMNEITSVLQRMRELSVYAGNDALTHEDREKIQSEIDQLIEH